jgi:hypothetical protein
MILFDHYHFISGIVAVTSVSLPSFNFFPLYHLFADGHMTGRNMYEFIVYTNHFITVHFVGITRFHPFHRPRKPLGRVEV